MKFGTVETIACAKCGKPFKHKYKGYGARYSRRKLNCPECKGPKSLFCLYCQKEIFKLGRRRPTFCCDFCKVQYYILRNGIYDEFPLSQISTELARLKKEGKNYD